MPPPAVEQFSFGIGLDNSVERNGDSPGAIVNLGFRKYAGKGQGEVSRLRELWEVLRPGDVLLTDRLGANWTGIVLSQQRGIESVCRLNKANRTADFRRG